MGNNKEIRQRMETYRTVLLVLVWVFAVAVMIGGLVMANQRYLQPYGIALIIIAIIGGIIGHFLVNVALAIPFILLNNGDYLAAIVPEGKIISSASDKNNSEITNAKVEGNLYEVTANTYIRDNPNPDANKEKQLVSGDKVVLINTSNENPNWYSVKTSDGKEGWCNSAYLKKC